MRRTNAQRVRQLTRTPHHFAPSGRYYDGTELCRYCNTPDHANHHAEAAIALARITKEQQS